MRRRCRASSRSIMHGSRRSASLRRVIVLRVPIRLSAVPARGSQEAGRRSRGVEFAPDSPLEGDGFEPSVPRQKDNAFRDSSFPTCARATAAFENARRPVQQLLLPVVDPVRMNAELTRQLGDRPVPPTAATTTPSL